jgi:hypothetical protein
MKHRKGKRSISGLAALVLLAVFAAGMLSVLLTGAGVYERLTRIGADVGSSRTCTQYLSAKVRQAPAPGSVSLSDFHGLPALQIYEEINGQSFLTRIYCRDGWLMELFTAADAGLSPEDGEKVLPARALSGTLEAGLLQLDVTDETGTAHTLFLSLRGKKEGWT